MIVMNMLLSLSSRPLGWRVSIVVVFVATTARTSYAYYDQVYAMHGSGTTNPEFCYWNILDKLAAQTKFPTKFDYRAVGSTVGQQEIANGNNKSYAPTYFGSGDLPFSTQQYDEMKNASLTLLQLPVLLGTVSFFHNVPMKSSVAANDNSIEPPNLTLSPCLLARIFTRNITTWTDPDIMALNPDFIPETAGSITVMVRNQGSSSTWAASNVSAGG